MIPAVLSFAAVVAGLGAAAALAPRVVRVRRPRGLKLGRVPLAAAACVAGLAAGLVLPGRVGLLAAAAAPLCGFFAPEAIRLRRRRVRLEAARRDLPALLDLLRVSIEAGAPLAQALGEVGARTRSPLGRQWAAMAAQVRAGLPLVDALESHRREFEAPEIDSFAAALERSLRHGAPLSATLAAQARDARMAQRRAVQERAARAGPKMQLVVALLLVPSVMLLVAAGLLSALSGDGAGGLLSF